MEKPFSPAKSCSHKLHCIFCGTELVEEITTLELDPNNTVPIITFECLICKWKGERKEIFEF